MSRWILGAVAALAMAPVALPGCGLGVRRQLDSEPILIPGVNTRSYPAAPHRVALATLEAMRAELASADFAKGKDNAFGSAQADLKAHTPPGQKPPALPRVGEPIPVDWPYFWVEWNVKNSAKKERQLVLLSSCQFEGKARNGDPVRASVKNENGQSVVTMQVGKMADQAAVRVLLEKIEDRLAHPLRPAGTVEEADTFVAFFSGVDSRESIPTLHPAAPAR